MDPTGLSGTDEINNKDLSFEKHFEIYSTEISQKIERRSSNETEKKFRETKPALVPYTAKQLEKVKQQMIELELEQSQIRLNVKDLLNNYYHNFYEQMGHVTKSTIDYLMPDAPGGSEYWLIYEDLPEMIEYHNNESEITGEIEILLSEYEAITERHDFVETEYFAQVKRRVENETTE